MACVEIAATHSKEGGTIFCEIIDADIQMTPCVPAPV